MDHFRNETEKMFGAFEGTYFTTNNTLYYLRMLLGLRETVFIVHDQVGLDEFLECAGFIRDEDNEESNNFIYWRQKDDEIQTLTIYTNLFDDDWNIVRLSMSEVKEYIKWEAQEISHDNDLPF